MLTVAANPASKVSFAIQDDAPPMEGNLRHDTPVTFTIPQEVQRLMVEHMVKIDRRVANRTLIHSRTEKVYKNIFFYFISASCKKCKVHAS